MFRIIIHELKTDPAVYGAVRTGEKTFEIRKDDRNFKAGDYLLLRKTHNTGAEIAAGATVKYAEGEEMMVKVIYVLHGPCYGLIEGWCIMSIVRCV